MIDTGLIASSDEEARTLVVCFIADKVKKIYKKKKLKAIKDKVNFYICGVTHEPHEYYIGEGFDEYIVHSEDGSLIYVYFNSFDSFGI